MQFIVTWMEFLHHENTSEKALFIFPYTMNIYMYTYILYYFKKLIYFHTNIQFYKIMLFCV